MSRTNWHYFAPSWKNSSGRNASLESLIGHLVHATKACPLGKASMRGLFHTLHSLRPGQPHRSNVATRADIVWWHLLCTTWSRISVHQFLLLGDPPGAYSLMHRAPGATAREPCPTGCSHPGHHTTACHPLPLRS